MGFLDGLKRMFGGEGQDGSAPMDPDMISCEEALSLIYEYLDGELDEVPQARVQAHFDVCQRCYPHLHLEKSFRGAVQRAARGEKTPPELKARLLELIAEESGSV